MKRIALSLMTIATVALLSASATSAYFSDTTAVNSNTFSTGILELRVNGQPTVTAAAFTPAAPGDMKVSPVYGINNYGQPHFGGPSTLEAKTLKLNVTGLAGHWAMVYGHWTWVYDNPLANQLKIKVEVGRLSGAMQYTAFDGYLKDLHDVDLLAGHWSGLMPGSTEDFRYTVYLPETNHDQSSVMGETVTWNFVIEGRTN